MLTILNFIFTALANFRLTSIVFALRRVSESERPPRRRPVEVDEK